MSAVTLTTFDRAAAQVWRERYGDDLSGLPDNPAIEKMLRRWRNPRRGSKMGPRKRTSREPADAVE